MKSRVFDALIESIYRYDDLFTVTTSAIGMLSHGNRHVIITEGHPFKHHSKAWPLSRMIFLDYFGYDCLSHTVSSGQRNQRNQQRLQEQQILRLYTPKDKRRVKNILQRQGVRKENLLKEYAEDVRTKYGSQLASQLAGYLAVVLSRYLAIVYLAIAQLKLLPSSFCLFFYLASQLS